MKIFGTLDTFIEGSGQDQRLGRQVANAHFLRALIRHSQFDAIHLFCPTVSHVRTLEAALASDSGGRNNRRVRLHTHLHLVEHLETDRYAAFHVGGWGLYLPRLAYLRARVRETGGAMFPLTGVTHSLHTADIFAKMREVVATPFGPCDAIVCTSSAGQVVMERHFALAAERHVRDGGKVIARGLRFPRIPLAVADECFEIGATERDASRRLFGLGVDDVALLYLGRLSPYTKADLHPLLYAHAALCRRAGAGGKRPHLFLAGGGDAAHEVSLRQAAQHLGTGDRVRVLRNVTDEQKRHLLAAADVFVSPVDNHQETFGLAVGEAMAAGLPVVGSDFDGYRDLIDEGVTGFRVPTYGGQLPDSVMSLVGILDPNLCGFLMAQTVVVDVEAMRVRLEQLVGDADLRMRLGAAGRRRARTLFSWSQAIATYEGLWDELAAQAEYFTPPGGVGDPQVGDLHAIFSHYPTATLGPDDEVQLSAIGSEVLAAALVAPALDRELLPVMDPTFGNFVLHQFRGGATLSLGAITAAAERELGIAEVHAHFQTVWLIKQGLLALIRR